MMTSNNLLIDADHKMAAHLEGVIRSAISSLDSAVQNARDIEQFKKWVMEDVEKLKTAKKESEKYRKENNGY